MNKNEEILKSAMIQLQSRSEATMLELNLLLSEPSGVENIADKVANLMVRLSITENAIIQTKGLYVQSMSQRLNEIPTENNNEK